MISTRTLYRTCTAYLLSKFTSFLSQIKPACGSASSTELNHQVHHPHSVPRAVIRSRGHQGFCFPFLGHKQTEPKPGSRLITGCRQVGGNSKGPRGRPPKNKTIFSLSHVTGMSRGPRGCYASFHRRTRTLRMGREQRGAGAAARGRTRRWRGQEGQCWGIS